MVSWLGASPDLDLLCRHRKVCTAGDAPAVLRDDNLPPSFNRVPISGKCGNRRMFQSQEWWLMPVIQMLWMLRQKDCHQFEASLDYRDTVST